MTDFTGEPDEDLRDIISRLRHPLVDVTESEQDLMTYIRARLAIAFSEGVQALGEAEAPDDLTNPYGDAEDCTCGYGGFHEPLNARCARNQWLADQKGSR